MERTSAACALSTTSPLIFRPAPFFSRECHAGPASLHLHAIDTDYISYEDERKLIQKDVGNSHSSPNIIKRK